MDKSIDNDVLEMYNKGFEKNRLRNDLGLIEFERTKEILLEKIPKTPVTIYDIGGGYGEYSWWLASLGHNVYLYDIAEKNIEMAKEMVNEYSGYMLKTMEAADARKIDRPDCSADVIILFGPLYHDLDEQWRDIERRKNIMNIVRIFEKEKSTMGLSTHLISIAKKN